MSKLSIRANYQDVQIPVDEILFIEALSDYVIIRTTAGEKYITIHTMKSMASRLSEFNFTRSHRSYIVNLDKVDSVKQEVIQIKHKALKYSVPVGRAYKYEFRAALKAA